MRTLGTRRKRSLAVVAAFVLAVLVGAVVMTGCQTPGQLISTEESVTCPLCKLETRTSSLKGFNFKMCVCPTCKAQQKEIWDGFYVEDALVQVCDKCQAVVMNCPACRAAK